MVMLLKNLSEVKNIDFEWITNAKGVFDKCCCSNHSQSHHEVNYNRLESSIELRLDDVVFQEWQAFGLIIKSLRKA